MIWNIIKMEFKKQLKDKSFFFWLLGMPILFIVLFSFIFGNIDSLTFNVHYVDEDRTEMSEQFLTIIEEADVFELHEESNVEQAVEDIRSGNITTLVYIPEGFEERMYAGEANFIEFHYDTLKQDSVNPVHNLIENISYSFQQQKIEQVLVDHVTNDIQRAALIEQPFSIHAQEQQSEGVNAITQIVPGYAVMFSFFIIISMVNSFLKDKDHGMLVRLATTPMNKYEYLLGKWFTFIIIVFIQIWALLGFGYFVYDLYLGNLLAIAALSFALTLTTTGIGLAISLISSTENFGIIVTQVLALGGAMLGGLWVPLELMPDFMQTMALFVPQYWAQSGFQDIMLRESGVADIYVSILVLLGVAVVGLLFAAKYYNRYLKGAKS